MARPLRRARLLDGARDIGALPGGDAAGNDDNGRAPLAHVLLPGGEVGEARVERLYVAITECITRIVCCF